MAYDVRLATRITSAVDRRLRMLALANGKPLSHVLDGLLDEALPSASELAQTLAEASREGLGVTCDGAAA